jgi:hypothetical protein
VTPEVWEEIRRDWKQSLPAVIAGEDRDLYPYGWAHDGKRPPSMRCTLHYICWAAKVDISEMLGDRRTGAAVRDRHLIYLLLRARFPKLNIARMAALVNRDHSSVLYGLQRARVLLKEDLAFRDRYDALKLELTL